MKDPVRVPDDGVLDGHSQWTLVEEIGIGCGVMLHIQAKHRKGIRFRRVKLTTYEWISPSAMGVTAADDSVGRHPNAALRGADALPDASIADLLRVMCRFDRRQVIEPPVAEHPGDHGIIGAGSFLLVCGGLRVSWNLTRGVPLRTEVAKEKHGLPGKGGRYASGASLAIYGHPFPENKTISSHSDLKEALTTLGSVLLSQDYFAAADPAACRVAISAALVREPSRAMRWIRLNPWAASYLQPRDLLPFLRSSDESERAAAKEWLAQLGRGNAADIQVPRAQGTLA